MSRYTAVPPPWTLKCTIYTLPFYISSSTASHLPSLCFSPSEASSQLAASTPKGGLGMIQVIRYTDSPVGPYDEMLIVPGYFECDSKDVDKQGKRIKKQHVRVSRIYVDSKFTCWNGRKNWNIPKHLARFEFNDLSSGGLEIKVFPYDTSGDAVDSRPSSTPFFVAKYVPISYLPYFPCSTNMAKYFGIDLHIVQPPLPEGRGSQDELPSTDRWCKVLPVEYSEKSSLGWWDLKQDLGLLGEPTERDALIKANSNGVAKSQHAEISENWWPGFRRWMIGVQMEDATVEFGEGEHWS